VRQFESGRHLGVRQLVGAFVTFTKAVSRQVPALEQLGHFDRTVPTIGNNGRRSTPMGPHKSSVSDVNLRRHSHTRIHHVASLTGHR
jgi:hypothetical protein